MKSNKLLLYVSLIAIPFCIASCDKEDDDLNTLTDSSVVTDGDYTATTEVKTATVYFNFDVGRNGGEGEIAIYEDFSNLYTLSLFSGRLCFVHYSRFNGSWSSFYSYGDFDICNVGKKSSLSDISKNDPVVEQSKTYSYTHGIYTKYKYCTVHPNYGYWCTLTTEDETLNMRVLITGYTSDENNNSSINSITIKYQLF